MEEMCLFSILFLFSLSVVLFCFCLFGLLDMRVNNSKLTEGALPGYPNTLEIFTGQPETRFLILANLRNLPKFLKFNLKFKKMHI